MNNPILMQVFDNVCDFLHDSSGLPLREELLAQYFVEQLSAAHELEHEVDLVLLLEHVAEADDVGVLPVPQQDLHLLVAVPLASVNNFNGVLNP